MSVAADPKPRKRYRASASEWTKMHALFRVESCWVCGQWWDSLHHIVRKSQGGDDVAVNLAPLCGSGTTGCHGKVEERDLESLAAIRAKLTPAHLHYITEYRKNQAWLDRHYPVAA